MIRFLFAIALILISVPGFAEEQPSIRQLYEQGQWLAIIQSYPPDSISDSEGFLYRGIALARLNQLEAAEASFKQGIRLNSSDKRLYQELAGVHYLQKKLKLSKTEMDHAYELDPDDEYTNEFLGTVYYLERNTEAAVLHWNRLEKPRIAQIRSEPPLSMDVSLADSAFAASPYSNLSYDELRETTHRLNLLNTFSNFRLELEPLETGDFDLVLRSAPRSNPANGIFPWLLSTFRNIFSSTLRPEIYNINNKAANLITMFRWDTENLRASGNFSFPFAASASKRLFLSADWRDEEWDLTQFVQGPLFMEDFLALNRRELAVSITHRAGPRIAWSAGTVFSNTELGGVPEELSTSNLFKDGSVLKLESSIRVDLLRIPAKRLNIESAVTGFAARSFGDPSFVFGGVEGDLFWHWFPKTRGGDYLLKTRFRFAKTFGDLPFDHLYIFGAEADTDLWLRAHKGLQRERKGSNPMGTDFILMNIEWDKIILTSAYFQWKLSPFLDTGTVRDRNELFGSEEWLVDAGIQSTFSLPGNVDVNLSFARDLRNQKSALILYASSKL